MERWDFAGTVRRWRERVTPDAVGLPSGGRRRAPGLRREELASLVGISVDYLTRLEQGRATSPSAQVVEALARGLRLGDHERELLFRLAGQPTPGSNVVSSRITPSVQRILDRLSSTPVAVFDAAWTLITANAPYNALMGETTAWRGIERNAVWRNLIGPGNRAIQTPAEKADLEEQLVADVRLTAAHYPTDRHLRQLVCQLSSESSRFVELWDSDAPAPRPARHKIIDHPSVGRIALDCDTLVVADDDLRLMAYSAEPGTDDAERLSLAIVLGTQQLVE